MKNTRARDFDATNMGDTLHLNSLEIIIIIYMTVNNPMAVARTTLKMLFRIFAMGMRSPLCRLLSAPQRANYFYHSVFGAHMCSMRWVNSCAYIHYSRIDKLHIYYVLSPLAVGTLSASLLTSHSLLWSSNIQNLVRYRIRTVARSQISMPIYIIDLVRVRMKVMGKKGKMCFTPTN